MSIAEGRPFNHYVCQKCGQTTITKHQHDGVTPFMLKCYATPGCDGVAYSNFYQGDQSPEQKPHVIWWRAENIHELRNEIKKYPGPEVQRWMTEHHDNGGCFSRLTEEVPQGVVKDDL